MKYSRSLSSGKAKGSFTVEAALIMPVILGIIVLFIYIAMTAHDRCTIGYICETVCLEAVNEGDDPERYAEEQIEKALAQKLILNHETDISTVSDDNLLTVTVSAGETLFGRPYVYKAKACKHFCPKY